MLKPFAAYLSNKRFESLDGLRAISIIAVIWHHTAPASVHAILASIGAQGVQLFFAISGFLITSLLLRERERNGKIDLKAFYLRRSLRIFPLYYGTLALYIILVFLLERHTAVGQAFFQNLIYFATYTSNLFVALDGRVIFYFAWSLAAEEQFYLVWPPLLLLAGTARRASLILIVVITACIMSQLLGLQGLDVIQLPIVLGALLAIGMHHEKTFMWLYALLGQTWSAPLAFVALLLGLLSNVVPGFVSSILFAALVGSCVIREQHPLTGLLTFKPLAYLGTISYGMYMLHMLCKNLVSKLLNAFHVTDAGITVFLLTLLITTAVASVSFRYYESWFLGWKTRFER
ncbi:acyltransferase family protein [Undibacterium pigrum]|uniref:Peptidoglycan/LPS O-acetylase OafA/YrhL n=1 Tax=Undibacterium pigrum TaxID=401470 RepID=A0A318K011_9BURK|nr:acyltransferase [Undibacterium pigrum]PXX46634.1 peptidoglycan/LPS O-acetylase OafA/YrhL [Undibacterium pigrum]